MINERKNRPSGQQKKTEEEHRKQQAPGRHGSGGDDDGGHRRGAHHEGHEGDRPIERSETDWPPAERSPSEELSQEDED